MGGVMVFRSLRDALDAGYHIYGKTDRGYLARLRTDNGWALAMVECGDPREASNAASAQNDSFEG